MPSQATILITILVVIFAFASILSQYYPEISSSLQSLRGQIFPELESVATTTTTTTTPSTSTNLVGVLYHVSHPSTQQIGFANAVNPLITYLNTSVKSNVNGSYYSDDPLLIKIHAYWLSKAHIDFQVLDNTDNKIPGLNQNYTNPGTPTKNSMVIYDYYSNMTDVHPKLAIMSNMRLQGRGSGGSSLSEVKQNIAIRLQFIKDNFLSGNRLNQNILLNGKPLVIFYFDVTNFTDIPLNNSFDPYSLLPQDNSVTIRVLGNRVKINETRNWALWSSQNPNDPSDMYEIFDPYNTSVLEEMTVMPAYAIRTSPKAETDSVWVERNNGSTYTIQWNKVLQLKPKVVFIYGWNEYAEEQTPERSTEIEPTVEYYDQYLQLTEKFAAQLKGLSSEKVKLIPDFINNTTTTTTTTTVPITTTTTHITTSTTTTTNPPQVNNPSAIMYSSINVNYLKETSSFWAENGFKGFILTYIFCDVNNDVYNPTGCMGSKRFLLNSSGSFDPVSLQDATNLVSELNSKGMTENFLWVSGYSISVGEKISLWNDSAWTSITNNFAHAADYGKKAGLKGIVIDTETFFGGWYNHSYAGHTDSEINAKVFQRAQGIANAIYQNWPDAVVIIEGDGAYISIYGGEPYKSWYKPWIYFWDGFASMNASQGLHYALESTFTPPTSITYDELFYRLNFSLYNQTQYKQFWLAKGTIVPGSQPLGTYANYSNKTQHFSPSTFDSQISKLISQPLVKKYVWINGVGSAWWQVQNPNYAKPFWIWNSSSNSPAVYQFAPTDPQILQFFSIMKNHFGGFYIQPTTTTTTTTSTTTTTTHTTTSSTSSTTSSTTTTTTTSTTSTSTTSTSTTTTTTMPPTDFSSTSFENRTISGGYNISLSYSKTYPENINIYFIVTNSSGYVSNYTTRIASLPSGKIYSEILCSNLPAGRYSVSWIAFLSSDTSLTNPIAWSKSNEIKQITC